MTTPMLEVEGLVAEYGKTRVLHGVSLRVDEAETVALLGRNGAGKTTCLRAIAGSLKPREGAIRLAGERIDGKPPHQAARLGIAHVKEGRRIFPRQTVRDNLLMGAYLRDDATNTREDLDWVLSVWSVLETKLEHRASLLSGGEQQMLAIAQALMLRPRLLLLDEPSIGLAPLLVVEIFEQISTLHERGITVLLVEQMVEQTLAICDRAYVLETGTVALEGTGEELLQNDRVEAAYLGVGSAGQLPT